MRDGSASFLPPLTHADTTPVPRMNEDFGLTSVSPCLRGENPPPWR